MSWGPNIHIKSVGNDYKEGIRTFAKPADEADLDVASFVADLLRFLPYKESNSSDNCSIWYKQLWNIAIADYHCKQTGSLSASSSVVVAWGEIKNSSSFAIISSCVILSKI